jgi:uncharacterized membrane protein YphA (DoxX/SURF4 family)
MTAPIPSLPLAHSAAVDRIDRTITGILARSGVPVLRIGLGLVFLWFGALKLIPGLSPAADLAARTVERLSLGIVPADVAVPILGGWEVLIGLGLITGFALRATLFLLIVQMAGTVTPLFLFPAETFSTFPLVPTLEGQYILKNVVLVGAAMVIGATVRGGRLVPEPARDVAFDERMSQ